MKSGLRSRINRWLGDGKPWRKIRHALGLDRFSPLVRRLIVGVLGGTLMLAGIAMVVLPGPAFLVIPLALAVLATEFVWAKSLFKKAHTLLKKATEPG